MLLFEPPLILLISVLIHVTLLRLLIVSFRLMFNRLITAIWIRHCLTVYVSIWAMLTELILSPNLLFRHLRVLLLNLCVLLYIAHWKVLIHPQSFSWPTIMILLMDILMSYWLLVLSHIWLLLSLSWCLFSMFDWRRLLLN